MNSLTNLLDRIPVDTLVRLLGVGVPLIAVLVLGNVALSFIERAAVRHSRKRGLELRARYSVSVLRYLLATVAIIVAAFSFAGSWTGLGVSLGVIAAAAGFALQRPAASVAAWIAILVKKPFLIGDRIAVGTIARGDVIDLTLTHITLAEVGRWGSEDVSGRTIIVPNNVIFELPVIRYGDADDLVLTEVEFTISYASPVAKARDIAESIAIELAGPDCGAHTRIKIAENGVRMELRFNAQVAQANRLTSDVSERILSAFAETSDVRMAYARMDVQVVSAEA